MSELWARRDFRRLLVGQAVSGFGDWMGTIAFMAFALAISGSPLAVGIVLVLRLLPAVLAGPLAVRLVERMDRKRTMMAMDLARAVVAAAVPLIATLWWLYFCAFVLELLGVAFLPARDSSVPDLAGKENIELANGLVLASSYGTIPLGAAAFAAVSVPLAGVHGIGRGGLAFVFLADAATFVASFLAIRGIRSVGRQSVVGTPVRRDATERQRAGAHHLAEALKIPLVRVVAPLALAVSLGLGALFSLGIVFVRSDLHADDASFSFLVALFGVGAGIGLLLLKLVGQRKMAFVRTCIFGQGVVIALMSLSPTIWLAYVGAVVFALFTSASLSTAMGILQQALSGVERVEAFAVFHVVVRAGLAVAAVGAGVAADVVGGVHWPLVGTLPATRLVLGGSGAAVAFIAVAFRQRFVAGQATADRRRRVLAPGSEADAAGGRELPDPRVVDQAGFGIADPCATKACGPEPWPGP
jgi:MFS family permease